jgi:hypothetical protein
MVRVLAAVAGTVVVAFTIVSALKTVVLPRSVSSMLTRVVFVTTRRAFDLLASPRRPFETRDRVLALYAPTALLLLPVTWIALLIGGFTLLFWADGVRPLGTAYLTSGSSLLTLGFALPSSADSRTLTFVAATIGLGVVALLISYLPTIYQAFSRREALVAMLETRAGQPPSPTVLLVRYRRIGWLEGMGEELFSQWEQWFAEVEESHTSQPALVFFRSPKPGRSWLTAAGCVLDTAAVLNAAVDTPHDPRADLTLRTGFLALRSIADFFGIAHDPDPHPGDPISVSRDEFDAVCRELELGGVRIVADRDAAWRAFAGWRVNYDTVLVALCSLVVAPPGQWSSDRTVGPQPRPKVWRRRPVHLSTPRS